MNNNNKILTVSYGTFSCTLEGFDDSFGTMKAIAEYFRDLASEDRYFGAEPPQPDAEMLARIAQREVSRRVEARQHDGRIVLSAHRDEAPAEDAVVQTPAAPDLRAAAPAPVADTAAPTAPMPMPEQVIAEAPALEEAEEMAPEARAEEAAEAPQVEIAEETPQEEIADEALAETAEAFFADSATDLAADIEEEEDGILAAPQAAPATAAPAPVRSAVVPHADSIAAKLERIRAVVSQHEEEAETEDYSEDEHAEAEEADDAARNSIMAQAAAEIEEAFEADDSAAEFATDSGDEEDEDDLGAILARLERGADAQPAPVVAEAEAADEDDGDEDEDEDDDQADNLFGEDAAELVAEADEDDDDDEDEEEAAAPPAPRTRVIKVRRAEFEAAVISGTLREEIDAPTSSLSEEEEEDLRRELSHVEAELADRDDDAEEEAAEAIEEEASEEVADTLYHDEAEAEDEAEDEAEVAYDEVKDEYEDEDEDDMAQAAPHPAAARDALPPIDADQDRDVSRLMEEAEHQMEEPEGSDRRRAFAHLRAAVAAKKADQALGSDTDEEAPQNAYRSDLAEVVRPRRPVATGGGRTARPDGARPAPLKLVAEQRIDAGPRQAVGTVQPRRVAAAVEIDVPDDDHGSFVEFAEEMGATHLPDLLEAAAAYMAFVEGRTQFSRPQLMTKVRMVEQDSFSREDGLRSFGQLLREGKIEKIKGGRFTVSEDIGFKPDERAAG